MTDAEQERILGLLNSTKKEAEDATGEFEYPQDGKNFVDMKDVYDMKIIDTTFKSKETGVEETRKKLALYRKGRKPLLCPPSVHKMITDTVKEGFTTFFIKKEGSGKLTKYSVIAAKEAPKEE